MGLEKIKDQDIHIRKICESFWIKKLRILKSRGRKVDGGIGDQDTKFVLMDNAGLK